ncbi:MAG: SUMF1/EgtB/PvdO family nonheme iron enzyme [Myxococcales bacterium]|nr:SUMF1/EgtB/PvdO family nonheme iron enzyme [Myxococcales bacterium]
MACCSLIGCSEKASGGEPSADVLLPPPGSAALSASASVVASASSSAAVVMPPVKARPALPDEDLYPKTIEEQRAAMFGRMQVMLGLDGKQLDALKAIFDKSPVMGQGNPELTEYAMTRKECRDKREKLGVFDEDSDVCGAPFMVPLFNPKAGQTEKDATACIDRFEFPNIPCEYPVTWISARDAELACEAIGKRLCDAHEWEGACAGAVLDPDTEYAWKLPRKEAKHRHNSDREIVWAYGADKEHQKCAMGSSKSKSCEKSGFKKCGSNSYPAGAFPECRSKLGVYDQHGNVAEHMNLPLRPEQLGSRGGSGETEMKGSWFIFQKYEAHDDDCRWRAPDWHVTKVMSHDSHLNYHLGFRCCKDVKR